MPVLAMAETVVDHQKRFQAAVDVIHNLPKNGSYRPSYDVMLRFYSLYKQAVCGPCTVPRPGFWDPVGRYKWDAWQRLGEMSSERAMAAYVDEMKKVAQEVIDSMPMNEKTASLFHHFEPLYVVIDDMPRPPQSLLTLTEGVKGSDLPTDVNHEDMEQNGPEDQDPHPDQDLNLSEVIDLTANPIPNDSGVCEGLVLTSDSESEIFCDSVDSVEQLGAIRIPLVKTNGFHNGHAALDSAPVEGHQLEVVERLAASQAQSSEWRCLQCAASKQQEERWWLLDMSGQTVVFFLLWPFVAQGLVHLLRKAQRRSRLSP